MAHDPQVHSRGLKRQDRRLLDQPRERKSKIQRTLLASKQRLGTGQMTISRPTQHLKTKKSE